MSYLLVIFVFINIGHISANTCISFAEATPESEDFASFAVPNSAQCNNMVMPRIIGAPVDEGATPNKDTFYYGVDVDMKTSIVAVGMTRWSNLLTDSYGSPNPPSFWTADG